MMKVLYISSSTIIKSEEKAGRRNTKDNARYVV
ncbi:hypothetical protein ACWI_03390 [Acetobacterium wieringae]|uniref:Uncharacterized protein n=1 Tax=Acetobacterium wieringae TaxID=52694 RepID=A0A1F2PKZ5_9FIRM|nr:hypothetical protein ACWI_03390 [Acetobacterium wieringae]